MNGRRITRTSPIGLRTRLALGTALATAMFGYGHRSAYAACVPSGPPGTYSCSGFNGSGIALSGSPLTVTTTPGFSVSTFGDSGLYLDAQYGLTFTDLYNSSIFGTDGGIVGINRFGGDLAVTTTGTVGAGVNGIDAYNGYGNNLTIRAYGTVYGIGTGIYASNYYSTGALNITATGSVNGEDNSGIRAFNYGTDLTINASGGVAGGTFGIDAEGRAGAMSITTTGGDVSGGNPHAYGGYHYSAIYAENDGTSLSITTDSVTGEQNGIVAVSRGDGPLTIDANGHVEGTRGYGIRAYNDSPYGYGTNPDGSSLKITATSVSGRYGIYARNIAVGDLSIATTGHVEGTYGVGIYAYNYGNKLEITTSSVSGNGHGIYAENYGGGPLNITATGHVQGNSDAGIFAYNYDNSYVTNPDGTSLKIDVTSVTGGTDGILALNYGAGALSITASGTVEGQGTSTYFPPYGGYLGGTYPAAGIRAYNGGTDLTIDAQAVIGAGYGIYAVNYGDGALSITTNGPVTSGANYDAILALNYGPNSTDLTVKAYGGVIGGDDAINAINDGNGALTINATGQVTALDDEGIDATNYGTDLTITAENITAGDSGIQADNIGSGALSITTTGRVEGQGEDGIDAYNDDPTTSLTIVANHVYGAEDGISATNYGSGPLSVTVSGTVQGGTGKGIDTVTAPGGTSDITLLAGADVSAASGQAISNNRGHSTTQVLGGASVTGAISLGDGNDELVFDGGNFAGVTLFDGGDDNSAADGFSDALRFRNVAGAIAGASVQNFELVAVEGGASIALSGALATNQLTVDNGGTLSAGASPGGATVAGNVDLFSGATLLVELGGTNGGVDYDQIVVIDDAFTASIEGIATLLAGATFDIDFFGGFTAALGDTFDVLVADSIVHSGLATLNFDFGDAVLGSGLTWATEVVSVISGDALRLTVVGTNTVPEADTLALFGGGLLGLAGLAALRRRPQRSAA